MCVEYTPFHHTGFLSECQLFQWEETVKVYKISIMNGKETIKVSGFIFVETMVYYPRVMEKNIDLWMMRKEKRR